MSLRFKPLLLTALTFGILFSATAYSEEQAFDFDSEPEPTSESAPTKPKQAGLSFGNSVRIFGRADITYEISPADGNGSVNQNDSFTNKHFLLFLKAQPSIKVEFIGEFINQSFYQMDYHLNPKVKIQGGKIRVPFGDPTRFHHYHGGLQGFGASGVMFPNIWAEHGLNINWRIGQSDIDTYTVNSISKSTSGTDPSFNSASNKAHQAFGARWGFKPLKRISLFTSGYFGNWDSGKDLWIAGLDLVSDYAWTSGFLGKLRFATGIAYSRISDGSKGDFTKKGDYIEIASSHINAVEPRFRFGTYVDNSKEKTSSDTNTLAAGLKIPLEGASVLSEYQWNFEAVNETSNDIFRIMGIVEF